MIKAFAMLTLVVTIALATAVVSANAQSAIRVNANVPFEFSVGGLTLPAGDYSIQAMTGSAALLVKNTDEGSSAVRLAKPIDPRKGKTQPRLVFHRYGQNYFLAEVWCGGDNTGRMLSESSRERSIKREFSQLAQNTSESIEIVARLQ